MKGTWVLVADEAIARIMEMPAGGRELMPIEELVDPDAHAKESEMHRGPAGRRDGSGAGATPRATVSAGDSERHQHAQAFAATIARRLAEYRNDGRYDALHVVAAPRLLGYLRKALGPNVSSVVVNTVDKDLVQQSNAELTRRLFATNRA